MLIKDIGILVTDMGCFRFANHIKSLHLSLSPAAATPKKASICAETIPIWLDMARMAKSSGSLVPDAPQNARPTG